MTRCSLCQCDFVARLLEHRVSTSRERESEGNGPFRLWARCLSLMATQSTNKYFNWDTSKRLPKSVHSVPHLKNWLRNTIFEVLNQRNEIERFYSYLFLFYFLSLTLFLSICYTFDTFFSTPSTLPSFCGMHHEEKSVVRFKVLCSESKC